MKSWYLFFKILLIPAFSFASHKVAGVELTYELKSSGKYDVFIHVIRHCDGSALGAKDLIARCSSFTVTVPAAQQTLVSSQKINICQSTPCNGIGNYEERVWKAELDLSSYSCCEWSVGYYNDFRFNGEPYYILSELNKCAEVSGGYFIQKPQITLRYNEDLALNFGFRSYDPSDSLSYELVTALTGMNQSMIYSGNYSPQRPIGFFGFPNNNLQWPAGFRLAYDGMLRFRPTLINNQGAIAVEVKIWKQINGIKEIVGRIVRDIEVVTVISNGDAPPSIDFLMAKPDTVNIYFCAGDTAPLIWQSKDADDDSTYVEMVYADPDIQVSTDYSQGKQIRINARISSTLADTASTKVRYLRFWLSDKACPYPRGNMYTLALRPVKKPMAQYSQTQNCRLVNTTIQVSDSVKPNFRAWYVYSDANNKLISSTLSGLFNANNLPLGTTYLNMSYGFQGGCLIDTSITLKILPDFKFAISTPDSFCEGDTLKLELLRQGSTGAYSYQWSNLTTPNTPYLLDSQEIARVFPPLNSTYAVKVTDSAGCFLSYTKQVRMIELPQYTINSLVVVCQGDSVLIGPSNILFSDFNIWMDGESDFPRKEKLVGWYSFTAIHENMCSIRDSVYLGNHTPPQFEKLPTDTNLCQNARFNSVVGQGRVPYTFYWNGTQTMMPRAVTQSEWVKIEVKDKNGCRDSVTFQLWVNEKPNLTFSPGTNLDLCEGDSLEIKVLNAPANSLLQWTDSTGPYLRVFYPGMYGLNLTDSIGCSFLYAVFVQGWPSPDPGFTYQTEPGGIAFTPDYVDGMHAWFFGDGDSSTAQLPIHKYPIAGTYLINHTVQELVNGCRATESQSIMVLTLPELEQWGISIFPNPFKEAFIISYPLDTEPFPLHLYDMQGKRISIQSELKENELHVYGLEQLASGTYLLRISTPRGPIETLLEKAY